MFNKKTLVATVLVALSMTSVVHADSTIVYELNDAGGLKIQHTISISGRWLRLDSQPKGKSDYTVMDLGRMLMFDVNDSEKNFQLTRMGRLYWPETSLTSPKFKPIPKKNAVSGIRCQPVDETGADNKSVAQHCMSSGGALGLNAREMITLSRLFMSARRLGLSWPGVATPDERQISLLSKNSSGVMQEFKSVTHQRIEKADSTLKCNAVNSRSS